MRAAWKRSSPIDFKPANKTSMTNGVTFQQSAIIIINTLFAPPLVHWIGWPITVKSIKMRLTQPDVENR